MPGSIKSRITISTAKPANRFSAVSPSFAEPTTVKSPDRFSISAKTSAKIG